MKFYESLNDKIKTSESNVTLANDVKNKEEATEKMKIYLAEKEKEVEDNFHDIDKIQQVFHEFGLTLNIDEKNDISPTHSSIEKQRDFN